MPDEPEHDEHRGSPDYPAPGPPPIPPLTEPNSGYPPARSSQSGPTHVRLNCIQCGYNLTGIALGGRCPECDAPVDESLYPASGATTNGLAITCMVFGIVSLISVPTSCCCLPIAPVLAVFGLVFGIIAHQQISTGTYSTASKNMNIAGLVCSGLTLVGMAGLVIVGVLGSI